MAQGGLFLPSLFPFHCWSIIPALNDNSRFYQKCEINAGLGPGMGSPDHPFQCWISFSG